MCTGDLFSESGPTYKVWFIYMHWKADFLGKRILISVKTGGSGSRAADRPLKLQREAEAHLQLTPKATYQRHKSTMKAFIRLVHTDSDLRYGRRCPQNQLSVQQHSSRGAERTAAG